MAGHGLTHDTLIAAFERRFDHYSARAVMSETLSLVGIAKADLYDSAALAKIAAQVEAHVARPAVILAGLATSGGAAKAEAPKAAEVKAEAPKADAPKADAHKAEGKAEAHKAKAEPAKAEVEAPGDEGSAAAPVDVAPEGDAGVEKKADKKK